MVAVVYHLMGHATVDALCTTCYYGYFSFEIHIFRFYQIPSRIISPSKTD